MGNRVCSVARVPRQRRHGVPSDPALGRAPQALVQEFEAFAVTLMMEMPVKLGGHILGQSDSRMWGMFFVHKAVYERLSFENMVWVGADEMNRSKRHNYLTVFADLVAKRVLFAKPGKGCLGLGSIRWGIAAAQRASQGLSACGDRYECGLNQWSQRQPWERTGGVRQVPRHPVCGRGLRPDSEDREPSRCRKARSAGANPVDVAEEPGEVDGKGDPEVGVGGPRTVCDGNGLRDKAGALRHL